MAVRMVAKIGSNVSGSVVPEKDYYEGFCDSNDVKPTGNFAEGSLLIETDTGNIFFYNERTSSWVRQFSLMEL